MGEHSTFLVARPSAVEGASRLLDFAGTLNEYNTSPTGEMADRRAIHADWQAINNDICVAIQADAVQVLSRRRA